MYVGNWHSLLKNKFIHPRLEIVSPRYLSNWLMIHDSATSIALFIRTHVDASRLIVGCELKVEKFRNKLTCLSDQNIWSQNIRELKNIYLPSLRFSINLFWIFTTVSIIIYRRRLNHCHMMTPDYTSLSSFSRSLKAAYFLDAVAFITLKFFQVRHTLVQSFQLRQVL